MTCSQTSSRALCLLHVLVTNSDWLIELTASVEIAQRKTAKLRKFFLTSTKDFGSILALNS